MAGLPGAVVRGIRRGTVLVAALLIVAIGSAGLLRSRQPDVHVNATAIADVRTAVPPAVISTLRRACFDCHSDDTRWPWYAKLPFASRLIARDVTEGRAQLNFSRWAQYNPFDRADLLDKVCDKAASRKMPPWPYRLLHFEARLANTDVAELCAWTRREATRLVQGGS
jgi:Haem-binding domain